MKDNESIYHPWAWQPNASILLGHTSIELTVEGTAIQACATAMLQLLPHPSVVFTFEGLYAGNPWIKQVDTSCKLMPQGVELNLALTQRSVSCGKISGTLIPQEPCTVLPTSERLKSVEFAVLNFPLLYGGQKRAIECEGGLRWIYRWLADPWQIEMTQVPGLEAAQKTLENQGGHAVTYTGTLTRPDGETFDVEDAEKLLEVLRLFLSFARGAFCSLPLRAGLDDNGNKIWEQ